jgi:hypothetical protein
MNIIERGRAFLQDLQALAARTVWEWRRCPSCGDTLTCRYGSYWRHPWYLSGRRRERVQRHWCHRCQRTYSEQSPWLVRGGWYAREVRRLAVDQWQHGGSSLRRVAEFGRSLLGRQERWQLWRPLDPAPPATARCWLSASTVQRWLDQAGATAQQTVEEQLAGVPTCGQVTTDGLWARLRGGSSRVVLLLVESVSGVVWPPVVARGEEAARHWAPLFRRAFAAGLEREAVWGVTSDGAVGLAAYLRQALPWVTHQRCVFHLWRNLGGEFAARLTEAATGLVEAAALTARQQARRELRALVRGVFDAPSEAAAWAALALLAAHPLGAGLAARLVEQGAAALVWRRPYTRTLSRVSPEWCWRDFRLRLGHGRNQQTAVRLERTALVWALYRNFTPAQERRERKRRYRYPGQCPLAVAGVPPGAVSYLDALAV